MLSKRSPTGSSIHGTKKHLSSTIHKKMSTSPDLTLNAYKKYWKVHGQTAFELPPIFRPETATGTNERL